MAVRVAVADLDTIISSSAQFRRGGIEIAGLLGADFLARHRAAIGSGLIGVTV
jgi:hypothetical protein